jgi:hypothetical protein
MLENKPARENYTEPAVRWIEPPKEMGFFAYDFKASLTSRSTKTP